MAINWHEGSRVSVSDNDLCTFSSFVKLETLEGD